MSAVSAARLRGGATAVAALMLLAGCARAEPGSGAPPPPAVARLRPRILATWPHDPRSFTQGLLFDGGTLCESSGLYGQSMLRRVALETGEALAERRLATTLFGEGLALARGELVQLTWKEGVALRYEAASLAPRGEYRYSGEGWGLSFDGRRFVRSDGSAVLRFHDALTFAETGRLEVTLDGRAVDRLNELEWSEDSLYANRLGSDEILRIDAATGEVTAVIDASGLLSHLSQEERAASDVLNGIAYDPRRRVFYLTGKLWPKLFEVVFEPAP